MSLWFLIWPDSPSWPSLECQFVPYQEALFPLQHNPQIWHVSPVLWGQHSCSFQWPSVFCLCTGKQGGTPEKISRSPELSRVLYFTRCITEQSFSVKPSLSAPDYHPVLPFSLNTQNREIEKNLCGLFLMHWGCRIFLWSAGFSFPSSVPSQTSPCLLATVTEWERKEVLMLWEHCSAIT